MEWGRRARPHSPDGSIIQSGGSWTPGARSDAACGGERAEPLARAASLTVRPMLLNTGGDAVDRVAGDVDISDAVPGHLRPKL